MHGPYPSHFVFGGGARQHLYGESGGSGGSGAMSEPSKAERTRIREKAEKDADRRWNSLAPEDRQRVEAILTAEVEVRRLARQQKRAVRVRVGELRNTGAGEPLREPTRAEIAAIEDEERERVESETQELREWATVLREALKKSTGDREGDQEELEDDPFADDDPFTEDFGPSEEKSEEDLRQERYEERMIRDMEKAERGRLYEVIMETGGIRTHDSELREEYQAIPNAYKRRDGLSGDEMAEHLKTNHPRFGITNENELIRYFRDR